MPINVTSVANFWARIRRDTDGTSGDGTSSPNAAAYEQFNPDIGLGNTTVTNDGDLRSVDTAAERLSTDATANSSGASSVKYSLLFLNRWLVGLSQDILNRLPSALVGGRLSVDGSGVTQPTSSTAIGATNDSAATSDTGTFSLISLFKRLLSRIGATRLYVATTFSTSGDNTIISAPAAGVRIVITGIRIQNNTNTATTVLLKDGASTTIARLRTTADGAGLSENYSLGDEIRLSAATAFVCNLSGANTHGISVRYWLETVSTGLPA